MSQQDQALLKLAQLESSLRAVQLVTNTNLQPHGSNIKRAIGRAGVLSHKFEVLKEEKLFVESGVVLFTSRLSSRDPWTRGLEPRPHLDSRARARLEPPSVSSLEWEQYLNRVLL